MTHMPTRLEAADESGQAEAGARINGVLDMPRPGRVSGWAIDRADPEAAVTVRVLQAGRLVGEVRADRHRPDLERGGIGTGAYGFSLDLDEAPEPGFEFTLTATARADDGATGPLRAIGKVAPAEDPARRLAERSYAELCELRAALAREARGTDAPLREAIDRIEVVQARIETALAGTEAPETRGQGGLVLAVALSLLVGFASLGLGIWSMLAG